VKAGDLVKIKRPSIGVPADTIGLIVDIFASTSHRMLIYEVALVGTRHHPAISKRRYIGGDLEELSTT